MTEEYTAEQMEYAFDEITDRALSALVLCSEASTNPEADIQAPLLVGVKSLIQQIGWIAGQHGGNELGDATSWMLPIRYHNAAETLSDESANDA